MCLSLTGRVRRIDGEYAVVDVDGADQRVSLAMLLIEETPVEPGDWVLIHTGLAVDVIDADEGAELAHLRRAATTNRDRPPGDPISGPQTDQGAARFWAKPT